MKFGPDIGQLQKGGADPVQVVKDFLPLVHHMHLKDFSGGEAFLGYCPLGEGKVNLPAILAMMDGKKIDGMVMVELDSSPNQPIAGQGHGGDREGLSGEAGRLTARLSATEGRARRCGGSTRFSLSLCSSWPRRPCEYSASPPTGPTTAARRTTPGTSR